jgi:hypothetical protein
MATKHEIIGEEWAARASELAEWAMERLVNRRDVWGQYTVLTPAERRREGRSYKAVTLPRTEMRGQDMVTIDKLTRHFASRHHRKPQIIGLHTTSKEGTCKWFGIDIDMHDEMKADAEDHARRNLNGAVNWWKELQGRGYDPLLFDTNGNGGYHLWVLLAEPAPAEDVYAMVKEMAERWASNGLSEEPETFPKQYKEDHLGVWFRLPGLHHTNYHYAKVWSGDEWLEEPWLEGNAAIDVMLSSQPGPPPPKADAKYLGDKRHRVTIRTADRVLEEEDTTPTAAMRKRRFTRTQRARVCVDLDGVICQSATGSRKSNFGEPFDGAAEFLKELSAKADIVIFTGRLANVDAKEQAEIKELIEAWFRENRLPFDEIYVGQGKPHAVAYVDDRAVTCRPEDDGLAAFTAAMKGIDKLL